MKSKTSLNDQLSPKDRKTRNAQLGRIHCMARELGWVGDNKDLLQMQVQLATGTDHLSELGIKELGLVMDRLKACVGSWRAKQGKAEASADNVIQLPTPGQRELANELLETLRLPLGLQDPEKYLEGIARKAIGKPVNHLNRVEFAQILEALKKIRSRY